MIFEGDISDAQDIRLKVVRLNEGRMSVQLGETHFSSLPETFALHPNVPNPFNSSTTIRYHLPKSGKVLLSIYNVNGQRIRTLVREEREAGRYVAVWDGKDREGREMASGIYLYRLQAGKFVKANTMVLLK